MSTNDESLTKVFHPNKPEEGFGDSGYVLYLNQQDWDKFMETINNPPEPSPHLIEAYRRYKERRNWSGG